jgi:peptide chain release factor 1
VTVAVFDCTVLKPKLSFKLEDVVIRYTKDSGPGGQHRNKTESCVVAKHIPSGIEVKSALKCQHQNKRLALEELEQRVNQQAVDSHWQAVKQDRSAQVGSGMRGDKIRTYREQDDVVSDHVSNKKANLKQVLAGGLDRLW